MAFVTLLLHPFCGNAVFVAMYHFYVFKIVVYVWLESLVMENIAWNDATVVLSEWQ